MENVAIRDPVAPGLAIVWSERSAEVRLWLENDVTSAMPEGGVQAPATALPEAPASSTSRSLATVVGTEGTVTCVEAVAPAEAWASIGAVGSTPR